MAERDMEGLSDLWKVTLLKKDSFVPASPFAPASASMHSTFRGNGKRLGCTHNRGLSNDVVTLSIWEFSLSITAPKGVFWAQIFCLGCPHCEFWLCLVFWGHRRQGRERPLLFIFRPQLKEKFGETYGETTNPQQLLSWTCLFLNSSIVKGEKARWQRWALLRWDSFLFLLHYKPALLLRVLQRRMSMGPEQSLLSLDYRVECDLKWWLI